MFLPDLKRVKLLIVLTKSDNLVSGVVVRVPIGNWKCKLHLREVSFRRNSPLELELGEGVCET
jgi:hypothetical protein